jgi:hypothetical protein
MRIVKYVFQYLRLTPLLDNFKITGRRCTQWGATTDRENMVQCRLEVLGLLNTFFST